MVLKLSVSAFVFCFGIYKKKRNSQVLSFERVNTLKGGLKMVQSSET